MPTTRRFAAWPGAGLIVAIAAVACSPGAAPERIAGRTMGTTYELLLPRPPAGVTRATIEAEVNEVLEEADRHLSGWNPDSEVSRFNAQGTDWFPASPVLFETLVAAQEVSNASAGAFDVTVQPLVAAWGFGAQGQAPQAGPSDEELEALVASVGYEKLELRGDPPGLRKSVPSLRVDLDGIAPGLAVDRIAARLEAIGVADYLVELGGEVRARGRNPQGHGWRVAVEAPLPGERRPYAILELDGVGVSTSGDYRDYREIAGRRVSHTIDPRTGRPVEHRLVSVTVVHASVAAADAWATALMVLGPEEGARLATERGLAALFIERGPDGALRETATAGFAALRRPLPPAI